MAQVGKVLIRTGVQAVLHVSAWLARAPRRRRLAYAWSGWLARRAIARSRIATAADATALGEAWQSAFPARKQIPITHTEGRTVYAQIRTPCPLRGSGDTHACYRMMEFDRRVAAAAGGRFVVLRSQAQPGVTVCEVALQLERGGAVDTALVAAHERAPGGLA